MFTVVDSISFEEAVKSKKLRMAINVEMEAIY